MNADPTIDAARWYDRLERENRLFSAGRISAEQDIKEGFALYFAGHSRSSVPVVTNVRIGAVTTETGDDESAKQAAWDALDSHEGMAALDALLQGRMSVESFREVLVKRHIEMWADAIALLRAGDE